VKFGPTIHADALFCVEFVQAFVTLLQSSGFELLPLQNGNKLVSI